MDYAFRKFAHRDFVRIADVDRTGDVGAGRHQADEAFDAYAAGNRLKRATLDADAAAQANAAAADYVKTLVTPAFLAAHAGQGSPSAAPIFVIGMPRSGSTLIEQILAAHPKVQGLGETGVLPALVGHGYPETAAGFRDATTYHPWPSLSRCRAWVPTHGIAARHHWRGMARERIAFQGLPARICWVGLGDRHRLGLAFNEMVAKGELKAPVVIGRDHLDSGSVASPNRETESMRDGSDAVSDWPMLNALLNCASGATWVSLHHGGGVGIGFSQHAGMVIVCDGSPEAARRIARVLWNDPATGVMRHADAGYEVAIDCAREKGLDLPGLG